MNDEDIYPFCAELNGFLSPRMNYKTSHCKIWQNKINARTSKFCLTISWVAYANSIEITTISFTDTRQGHCTALLNFLSSLANKYGYERIEFVSVCSEAMRSFVTKFEFTNHQEKSWFDDTLEPSKNWSKLISGVANASAQVGAGL